MVNFKERLLDATARIQDNDKLLADELQSVRQQDQFKAKADEMAFVIQPGTRGLESLETGMALESIVLRVGRPVLRIYMNEAVPSFEDPESEVWRQRLSDARQQLLAAIPSIGRIELKNNPSYEWVGTGWLISEDMVITNRHVANIFSLHNGSGFTFRQGTGGRLMESSIDFLEEANRTEESVFNITKVIHIEEEGGPDMAFLRIRLISNNTIPKPILLSDELPADQQQVAVIGYPARDSRIPDQQLMEDIFGNLYNKKRLSPGQVNGVSETELLHDCSTLGGNSGSVVLDLQSGKAVGLHFAGRFLESNFAVPAALIRERLRQISSSGHTLHPVVSSTPSAKPVKKEGNALSAAHPATSAGGEVQLRFNIPVEINVSVGMPQAAGQGETEKAQEATAPKPGTKELATAEAVAAIPGHFSELSNLPGGGFIRGIDISHHNNLPDWKAIQDAGVSFVYIKISEGVGTPDDHAQTFALLARQKGFKIGYYHFGRPDTRNGGTVASDAAAEVGEVKNILTSLPTPDLPMMLDLEESIGWDSSLQPADYLNWVETFLASFYDPATPGNAPLIYSRKEYLDKKLPPAHTLGSRYKLWLSRYTADYNRAQPARGWTDWSIWQFTEAGLLGINSSLDLDIKRLDA